MRPFLQEVAETLHSRAPARLIETACEDQLHWVTDWTLLYRIVFNLGDNALKYSDGPVGLAARVREDGICIQVTDSGVGIPEQHLGTIFQQFRQLDTGNSHRAGGVGLGLHLSARMAEALGGRIDVHSEVGRGSTFSVWLPNKRTDQVVEAAPSEGQGERRKAHAAG